jgi:hypothetical protein
MWKSKSGWFLFVMSLGLSVAIELLLWSIADFFNPWFAQNQPCTTPQSLWNSFLSRYNVLVIPMICFKSTLHHTTEPMKLFLVPTMVFFDPYGTWIQRG